ARACVVPVACAHGFASILVQAFGAPARGGVLLGFNRAAAGNDANHGKHDGRMAKATQGGGRDRCHVSILGVSIAGQLYDRTSCVSTNLWNTSWALLKYQTDSIKSLRVCCPSIAAAACKVG